MQKKRQFFIKAEAETSVETNPANGCAVWEAEVRSWLLPGGQLPFECVPV